MGNVVHTGMDPEKPWLNKTVQSRNRDDILNTTGSRYAPASPCEGLDIIRQADNPGVFIGKPCDVTAVSAIRQRDPQLDKKLGLVLTFFCAGTPSIGGTNFLLDELGIKKEDIKSLRYRGEDWPGGFKVRHANDKIDFLTYKDSWTKLQRYRPFRCHLCPDGLGALADLSCGDAWEKYTDEQTGDSGRSLVLVRTKRGRDILYRAMQAGYIKLQRVGVAEVLDAQVNLLQKRKWAWGRLLAMKLLRTPTPNLIGFHLWQEWHTLPIITRLKTIAGTIKRVIQRKLYQRKKLF